MRVLVAGDTHASRTAIQNIFNYAENFECSTIFQVGDFGFWPADVGGKNFLSFTSKLIDKTGIDLYFLPGNHEDWNELDDLYARNGINEDGFHLYDNIHVAPRSNAWVWDNVRFMNLSGAFSIDRKFRTKNISWFEQETPRLSDITNLENKIGPQSPYHFDVCFSHDAPVNLFSHQGHHEMVFDNPEAFASQETIAKAIEVFDPNFFIHGHWHQKYDYFFLTTFCLGLDQASGGRYWACVIDTETRAAYLCYDSSTMFQIHEF